MTTITLTFVTAAGLTDQASVIFSDQGSPAKGVIRTDTDASVVAAGTALTRRSQGVYSYTFADPVPGLTYNSWITRTPIGGVQQPPFMLVSVGGTGLATSPYHSYRQFVNRWGLNNIVLWSQKDSYNKSNPTPNYEALQDAFDYAADEINSAFSQSVYVTPFVFLANSGVTSPVVREWALILGAWSLYNARGFEEKNKVEARFDKMQRRVYDDMGFYRTGIKQLNAAFRTDINTDMSGDVVTTTDVLTANTNNNPFMYVLLDGSPIYFHL